MIVYSSLLHLVDRDPRPAVRHALRQWLDKKTRRLPPEDALRQGMREVAPGQVLAVEEFEFVEDTPPKHRRAEHDWVVSYRYTHPDQRIQGRRWITEIGVSAWGSKSVVTVKLSTEEQSTLANDPVATTRPGIVDAIQRACTLHSKTPGRDVRALRLQDADGFAATLRDEGRRHPILVVSPTMDGKHVVDPARLAALCIGVADVVAIPGGEDTYALERALGAGECPYHGAVDVIWPVASGRGPRRVPRTRILAEHLAEMLDRGLDPHSELLARVCHETNATVALHHHDLAAVRHLRLRSELDVVRAKLEQSATPDQLELIAMYEQIEKDDKAENERLKESVEALRADLRAERTAKEEAEEAVKQAQRKADSLEHAANAARRGRAEAGDDTIRFRESFLRVQDQRPTLEDSLIVLERMFPDRLVILDTAWKSAHAVDRFQGGAKAFDLLRRLCTGYHDAMTTGGGDKKAIEVFGSTSFAARESETVENNKRARSLRTFAYEGSPVEMMRHLKIGVKPSDATTFRAHFHWDAAKELVVLGHCGGHLDHD